MKICPIAIAVGCARCPVVKVCPLTSVIGDQPAKSDKPMARPAATATTKAPRTAKTTRPAAPAKASRSARPAASRKKSR